MVLIPQFALADALYGLVPPFVVRILHTTNAEMYLMYYLNETGDRIYTLKHVDPSGKPTLSAHPARFSPEDKYSQYRLTIKKRFKLLPTQQPAPVY